MFAFYRIKRFLLSYTLVPICVAFVVSSLIFASGIVPSGGGPTQVISIGTPMNSNDTFQTRSYYVIDGGRKSADPGRAFYKWYFICIVLSSLLFGWVASVRFFACVSINSYNFYIRGQNSVYKKTGYGTDWWESYKNETLIPRMNEEECSGQFRFPAWKERKLMDPREFVFRNLVAFRILSDPEKLQQQPLLMDSIKHI